MPDLTPGQTLGGHFEILERLGGGGMGDVYKARDTRLGRLVAIKAIRNHGERFEREARAVAALNHPHIGALYDIGPGYLVMEYVDGAPLRGPLPLNEVWKLGAQTAAALAAAHAAGITHRDLKPDNILVTRDQRVKVLDFGLAKLQDPAPLAEDEATRTQSITREGTVVGTAAYMSPEQAAGKAVDARSDIFSLGVVLYELITGRRAFQGDTRMSVLAAVLRDEPKPLGELAPQVPAEAAKLIGRMLRKDPERRVQSMADVRLTLEDLLEESASGASALPNPVVPGRASRRGWILAAAALALVGAGAGWLWWSRATPPAAAPPRLIQVTSYPGIERHPAISPDGRQVAFAWDGDREGAPFNLYVKLVDTGDPVRLTNTGDSDGEPAWSPDGNMIAFRRRGAAGGIYVIPALGGAARRVVEIMPGPGISLAFRSYVGLAWSPDGKMLFYTNDAVEPFALGWAELDGSRLGTLPAVHEKVGAVDGLAVSPEGTRLLFRPSPGNSIGVMMLGDLAAGPAWRQTPRALAINWAGRPAWLPDGSGVVGETPAGLAWASLDSAEPRLLGLPAGATYPSVAAQAPRLAFATALSDTNIWRLPAKPVAGAPARAIASSRIDGHADAAAPGGRVVFVSSRGGASEVWAADADGGNAVALTSGVVAPAAPRLSPDGKWVVFTHRPRGSPDIYLVSSGGGPIRQLTNHPAEDHSARFSRDGQWIYFCSGRSGRREVWKLKPDGSGLTQVTRNGGWVSRESADGKWLYFTRDGSTAILRIPAGGGAEEVVIPRSSYAQWDVGSTGIYFAHEKALWFQPFGPGQQPARLADVPKLGNQATGLSLDGEERLLYFTQVDAQISDIMVLDQFRPRP